jgi:two-component system, NtrC family, response regulator PilR
MEKKAMGKGKILIVDDEPSMIRVLSLMLKAEGYEVTATEDSSKAVAWLRDKERAYDLMISDVRMTPVDGMQLLRMARESHPSMRVLMVTAYASDDTVKEAKQLGACDYISKPFRMDQILAAVRVALQPSPPAS